MNEALAGFWWFEDLSLLMDRGGHVLWAILVLSTVLWMILLTGARRLKDAEKAWTAATAAPALEWATATAASRRRMMQAALVRGAAAGRPVSVVVNADRLVPSGLLIEVIDQIRLGGVANVAVATNAGHS